MLMNPPAAQVSTPKQGLAVSPTSTTSSGWSGTPGRGRALLAAPSGVRVGAESLAVCHHGVATVASLQLEVALKACIR